MKNLKIKCLSKEFNVDGWKWYKPSFPQYTRYSPHQILAGFKIEDIYIQIKNARSSLLFMESDSYKPFVIKDDELHTSYIRSKFLFDAMANYNYCIDLSWQFLYLYYSYVKYGYDDYGMLQEENFYEKETKSCKVGTLKKRLIGAKQEEKWREVSSFLEEPLTEEIRNAYNYIKHRGTYHVKGLGIQGDDKFPTVFSGNVPTLKFITRETIDLDEWREKLINFDISFYQYFDKLIQELMPDDFTEGTIVIDNLPLISQKLEEWHQKTNNRKDK